MKKLHIAAEHSNVALCNKNRKGKLKSRLVTQLERGKINVETKVLLDRFGIVVCDDDTRLCKMCLAILHDGWTVQIKDGWG